MRFPQTAALIAQEGTDIIEAIFAHEDFQALLERKMEAGLMASVQELKTALDGAKSSFDTLVGKVGQSQGGIDPSELDPVLAEIKDLASKIEDVKASLPGSTDSGSTGSAGSSAGVPGDAAIVGSATNTGASANGTASTAGTAPVNPLS